MISDDAALVARLQEVGVSRAQEVAPASGYPRPQAGYAMLGVHITFSIEVDSKNTMLRLVTADGLSNIPVYPKRMMTTTKRRPGDDLVFLNESIAREKASILVRIGPSDSQHALPAGTTYADRVSAVRFIEYEVDLIKLQHSGGAFFVPEIGIIVCTESAYKGVCEMQQCSMNRVVTDSFKAITSGGTGRWMPLSLIVRAGSKMPDSVYTWDGNTIHKCPVWTVDGDLITAQMSADNVNPVISFATHIDYRQGMRTCTETLNTTEENFVQNNGIVLWEGPSKFVTALTAEGLVEYLRETQGIDPIYHEENQIPRKGTMVSRIQYDVACNELATYKAEAERQLAVKSMELKDKDATIKSLNARIAELKDPKVVGATMKKVKLDHMSALMKYSESTAKAFAALLALGLTVYGLSRGPVTALWTWLIKVILGESSKLLMRGLVKCLIRF